MQEVFPSPIASVDHALFVLLNQQLQHPVLDVFLGFLTDFANFKVPLVIAGILVLVLGNARLRLTTLWAVVAVLLADMIGQDMKLFFDRPRPYWALEGVRQVVGEGRSRSPSFPSNHAVNTAAAGMTFLLVYWRRWWVALPAVVVPLLVAWSRVYVGVHYPLDVLAGALIGAGVAGGLQAINRTETIVSVDRARIVVGWKGLALFLIGVATLYRFSTASRAGVPLGGPELAGWYAVYSAFQPGEFGHWIWQAVLKLWALPFGVSEFSFRALGTLASLGVLALAWRTANALGLDRRMRAALLFLLILSPFQILGTLFLQPASLAALPVAAGVLFTVRGARGLDPCGRLHGLLAFSAALLLDAAALPLLAALLLAGGAGLAAEARQRPLMGLLALLVLLSSVGLWVARLYGYTLSADAHGFPGTAPWMMLIGAVPMVLLCGFLALAGGGNKPLLPAMPILLPAAFVLALGGFLPALVMGGDALGVGMAAWYLGAFLVAPRAVAWLVMPLGVRHRAVAGACALAALAGLAIPAANLHDRAVWRSMGRPFLSEETRHLDPAAPFLGGRELGRALSQLSSDNTEATRAPVTSPGGTRALAALHYSGSRDASRFLPWGAVAATGPAHLVVIPDGGPEWGEIPGGYTVVAETAVTIMDRRREFRADRMLLLRRE